MKQCERETAHLCFHTRFARCYGLLDGVFRCNLGQDRFLIGFDCVSELFDMILKSGPRGTLPSTATASASVCLHSFHLAG